MLINLKGYPNVFVPLICKNCKNSLLHPDTFKWYCCYNTPASIITEDIDDCPNMVPRLNQFVIAESPHDALQTFITQNPYSTYPTPEQAQKRIDEMFISNYGLDVGIYKIEASLVSWGTSIIT